MKRHYESLNYFDRQPSDDNFRFTRTQGAASGYLTFPNATQRSMGKSDVQALRDMLNEVLEDWK